MQFKIIFPYNKTNEILINQEFRLFLYNYLIAL